MKLIDKDAVVAEIERRIKVIPRGETDKRLKAVYGNEAFVLNDVLSFIDTLEVKGVDLDEETLHSELRKIYTSVYDSKDIEAAKHFFELGVRVQKEEKYEVPSVSKTEDVSVTSRMAMIDDDLKPIAEFILDYVGWNLHKDEWNHPVLEVPLFRVLDALIQRGKPYCGKN